MGLDICVEETILKASRRGLTARVRIDGAGVHYGASEPRHDGAAIPDRR